MIAMPLEAEVLVDRRRLQRKLSIWRIGAILALLALVIALAANNGELSNMFDSSSQIARIKVTGMITDDREQQAMLEELAKSDKVKAVLMHVNSPGGTTTGGEALYAAIRRLSEKKPVVAVFGTVAASAAYIAGLATDRIVARGNTITGSVGVIFQFTNVVDLMNKIGVKMEEIKSGPLKASPSPFQPMDEAGRKLAQDMVMEAQGWFLGLVKERRKLNDLQLEDVKDGRIFSGRQALERQLVDEIGGEKAAVKWLESKKSVPVDLPIKDWKPKGENEYSWLTGMATAAETILGLPKGSFTPITTKGGPFERLRLDGLISIWQPISKS